MKTLSLLLVVLLPLTVQAKGPGIDIGGPDSLTSDREKPVVFSLSIVPAKTSARVKDIQVKASAGVVLGIETTQTGTRQFKYRPPWVAAEMTVRIDASAKLNKRTLHTHKLVRVKPARIEIGEIHSAGPAEIHAPALLIFDRHESAKITLKQPKKNPPRMLVSTGRLSELKQVEGGRLEATYFPPEERFPQVAIIAAHGGPGLLDWIAIPLHAQARVDTRTEPGASVDILIGETIFGPLRADRKGRANMDVLVPPGIPRGTTIATDHLGNTKKAGLNLRVPAFRRILGLCPIDTDRLRIIAVDAHGRALPGAELMVKTTRGTLSPPEMATPGVYESILSLPEGVPIGETLELSAGIRGDKASQVTCSTRVKGLPPASMKLSVATPTHVAGGPPLAVSIDLLDAHGQPARMVSLEITTTLGKVSGVRSEAPGRYAASWTLPTGLQGLPKAGIKASTRGQPLISSETTIELKAGQIARIELTSAEPGLAADGRSSTTISARAVDQYGNRVAPVRLSARAKGAIGKLTDLEKLGTYRAIYTAPEMTEPQPDTIVVTEAESKIEASLKIDLRQSRPALTIGPRIGYSTNLGRISSAYFAADAGIRLPFFPDLTVGVEFGYYWSDSQNLSAGGEEQVNTSVWVLPILARATYSLPLQPVTPYLGFGVGTAIVSREVFSESSGEHKNGKAHFGLSGILGADFSLGPGQLVAELTYLYIPSNEAVVQGDTGGLLVSVGYRFGF